MANNLPLVGVTAVVENLAQFEKASKAVTQGEESMAEGAVSVEKASGGMSKGIGAMGSAASAVATGGLALLATAAGAVVVGFGAVSKAAFDLSSDVNETQNSIQAELGLTTEEAEKLGNVALEVWGDNFAGSVEEAGAALIETRKQLKNLNDNELKQATENAIRLSDTFGVDIAESTNSANALMEKFGLTQQEAFDFIAKGFQKGLNNSDDFIDSISEYSNLFSDAGFSAEEMFSLMESGAAAGVLGTDKIADAVKEMGIRLNEGAKGVPEAFAAIGMNFEHVSAAVAAGTTTWGEQFEGIVERINRIEDPLVRASVQTGIFGTMAEDLGISFTEGLSTVATSIEDMAGATDILNAKYETLPAAFEGVKRQLLIAVKPIGDALLDVANEVMPMLIEAFNDARPEIERIAKLIGDVLVKAVKEFIPWVQKKLIPFVEELLKNFAEFKKRQKDVTNAIDDIIDAIKPLVDKWLPKILDLWDTLLDWTEQNWPLIQKTIQTVMDAINSTIKKVLAEIEKFWDRWGDSIMAVTEFIFDTAFKFVKTGMQNILDVIKAVMQIITGDWEGAWDTILGIVQRNWDLIGGVISDAIDTIKVVIGQWINNIKADITTGFDTIKSNISTAINNISSTISNGFNTIRSNISTAMSNIKSSIESKWNEIITSVSSRVTQMINTITTKISGSVGSIATSLINAVSGAISSLQKAITDGAIANDLKNIGSKIISKIAETFSNVTDFASRLRTGLSNGVNAVINYLGDLGTKLTSLGSTIISNLGTAIFNGVDIVATKIRNTISTAISRVWDGATQIFDDLKAIGSTIISNVVSSISANVDQVKNALKDIVEELVKRALDWLGIGSPSKVMADMGANMMSGLSLGLQSQIPTVTAQLQAAIAAPAAVAAPALGASTQTIVNNTFNVGGNTIASGMSEAEFEARVIRTIQRNL